MQKMDYVPAKILIKQASSTYAPLNLGSDGLSGYAVAIPSRHDRIDYSMTKGGLRLWLSVLLFLLLLSGMTTFMKQPESDIETDETELDSGEQDSGLLPEGDITVEQHVQFDEEERLMQLATKAAQISRPTKSEVKLNRKEKAKVEVSDERVEKEEATEPEPVSENKNKSKKKISNKKADKISLGMVEEEAIKLAEKETEEPTAETPEIILKLKLKKKVEPVPSAAEDSEKTHEKPKLRKKSRKSQVEVLAVEEEAALQESPKAEPEITEESKESRLAPASIEKRSKKSKSSNSDEIEEPVKSEEHEISSDEDENLQEIHVGLKKRRKKPKQDTSSKFEEDREGKEIENSDKIIKKKLHFSKVVQSSVEDVIENAWKIVDSLRSKATDQLEKLTGTKETVAVKVRKSKGRQSAVVVGKSDEVIDSPDVKVVKVHRTKGKTLTDDVETAEAPRKITVKVKHTKGKLSREVPNIETDDHEEEDSEENDVETETHDKHDEKELIRVKHSKGKPSKMSNEVSKHESDAVEKPAIKIKVHHSKGTPPKDDVLEKCSVDYESCEEEEDDENPSEKYTQKLHTYKSAKASDLKINVHRTKGKLEEETPEPLPTEPVEAKPKTTAAHHKKAQMQSHEPKITNKDDRKISPQLVEADRKLENLDLLEAIEAYDKIIMKYPTSPRANFGKARALDQLSEMKKSNKYLEQAIELYELILDLPDLPTDLFSITAKRLIDRLKYRGWYKRAITVQRSLIDRHPEDIDLLIDYGISYLILGRGDTAKKIFLKVLQKDPENGHASSLYGFILKTEDQNLEEAIVYLKRGMESGQKASQDARFYFHLGDALQRLNRSEEAYEVYDKGVEEGLFLSRYQRSIYNVDRLRSQPWWNYADTSYEYYLKMIESEWRSIRDEGVALLNKDGQFMLEDESLTKSGDWRQFDLFVQGKRVPGHCEKAPRTCAIVEKFPAATSCTRGQVKFSVMKAGSHVWPHCGPTNARLRAHLGLVVPPDPRIRVGEEVRTWKRGKFIIFDDSFEHEVWYDAKTGYRLVLIVDFWHPDISNEKRMSLDPL